MGIPSFGTPLDMVQNEVRNLRLHVLASAPGSPVTGQPYYDSTLNKARIWNGTAWEDWGGSAADATTGSKGIVQLAGDLGGAGTAAAAPLISAGAITAGKVSGALKPSGTAATSDEALRALGFTTGLAMPGTARLDQIAVPTADVSLSSHKLTNVTDPTSAQDAATKAYVDATAQGLDVKASVRAATTAAGTLASSFENGDAIDGVTLATGNRILIKDQAAPADNGIYTVNASGAPTRATDFDSWAEIPGAFVFVEEGTANADNGFVSTANAGGTLGTTAITFTQFSGAGQITAGAALTKTGNTLDVGVDGSTIEVNADALRVKAGGITANELGVGAVDLATTDVTGTLAVAKGGTGATAAAGARTNLGAAGRYSNGGTHSSGTTISIPQSTHGQSASRELMIQVRKVSDGSLVFADEAIGSGGDVTLTFAQSQGANSLIVLISG